MILLAPLALRNFIPNRDNMRTAHIGSGQLALIHNQSQAYVALHQTMGRAATSGKRIPHGPLGEEP
jgi:hypothetical protein